MTIITDSTQNKSIIYSYFNFNLNPELIIIPIITVKYKDEDFYFLARFNFSLHTHKNKETKIVSLHILILHIYFSKNIDQLGVIMLAENIVKKDYLIAIEIFKLIPSYAEKIGIPINETIENITFRNYNAIGIWLEHWHLKKSTRELKINNSVNWVEKEAMLTLKRYELIYELYNLKKVYFHHNLIWLLVEINILCEKYQCESGSKEQIYRHLKNRYNYMGNLERVNEDGTKNPPEYYVKDEDLLEHLENVIETTAYNVACENPDFDKHYYKPYIKAAKSANSYAKKNLYLINPSNKKKSVQKRPGGKIGHKKNKRNI